MQHACWKKYLHLFCTYGTNRHAWYLLIIRLSFVSPNYPYYTTVYYFLQQFYHLLLIFYIFYLLFFTHLSDFLFRFPLSPYNARALHLIRHSVTVVV